MCSVCESLVSLRPSWLVWSSGGQWAPIIATDGALLLNSCSHGECAPNHKQEQVNVSADSRSVHKDSPVHMSL